MVKGNITPSMNRGPGPIETSEDAKTLRQKASQAQTSAKKRKFQLESVSQAFGNAVGAMEVIAGEGGRQAAYNAARNKLGRKGVAISELICQEMPTMFGPNWQAELEPNLQESIPKYEISADPRKQGDNLSPLAHDMETLVMMALKNQIRGSITAYQARVMADAGVAFWNAIAGALRANPHTPNDDDPNEIQACGLMSFINAPYNAPLAPADRIKTNKFGYLPR